MPDTIIPPRENFQPAYETNVIYEMIVVLPVGGIITYEELEVKFQKPKNELRGNIISASNRARKQDEIVMSNIRNVGYERLPSTKIIDESDRDFRTQRRVARKSHEKLSCAENDKLTQDEKYRRDSKMSMMSLIENFSKPKKVRMLEAIVRTIDQELSVEQTLKYFSEPRRIVKTGPA